MATQCSVCYSTENSSGSKNCTSDGITCGLYNSKTVYCNTCFVVSDIDRTSTTCPKQGCTCNSACHQEGPASDWQYCSSCYAAYACNCDGKCNAQCTCNTRCNRCDDNDPCTCNATCYGYSACSCNSTCYLEPIACTCNSLCYLETRACTCDSRCNGYVACSTCDGCNAYIPCSCDGACYQESCSQCHSTEYWAVPI